MELNRLVGSRRRQRPSRKGARICHQTIYWDPKLVGSTLSLEMNELPKWGPNIVPEADSASTSENRLDKFYTFLSQLEKLFPDP